MKDEKNAGAELAMGAVIIPSSRSTASRKKRRARLCKGPFFSCSGLKKEVDITSDVRGREHLLAACAKR